MRNNWNKLTMTTASLQPWAAPSPSFPEEEEEEEQEGGAWARPTSHRPRKQAIHEYSYLHGNIIHDTVPTLHPSNLSLSKATRLESRDPTESDCGFAPLFLVRVNQALVQVPL